MLNDFALERMLQDRSWNFGYAADAIIVRDLVLHPGGRFAGYSHANERAWRIAANALEFLSQAGAVTTRFDTVSVDETGRYHLSGKFLGEPNSTVTHTLYESDLIKPMPGQRNKTALLIPIHDAYFVYGINLLLQSFGADYDLIFIFSTQEDRVKFGAMHQMSSFVTYGSIILAEHLDAAGFEILGAKYTWPTFKQMLALTLAHASYDYLICVDAETFILRNIGWTDAATTIVDSKTWYGGDLPDEMGERNILRLTGTELPPVHDHAEVARVSVGFRA